MTRLKVVTVKDDTEKTLKLLQKTGVLHAEESSELQPVDRTALEQEHREISELYNHITKILSHLHRNDSVTLEEDVEVIYTRPFSEIRDEIKTIYNRTNRLQEKIEAVDIEYTVLKNLNKYLRPLVTGEEVNIKELNYTGKYLISRVVVVSNEAFQDLRTSLKDNITENVVAKVENETVLHLVAHARYREKIESAVQNSSGMVLNIPGEDTALSNFLDNSSKKMGKLDEEKNKLIEELDHVIGDDLKKLVLLREALEAENDKLTILEKAAEAKYVNLIEGWIPDNTVEATTSQIKETIDYAFIDTRKPEPGEEPPTKYRNPAGFKPFQIIVNMFSTPKYRQWDPTPVVTYSFAFFFGLMVCDVLYAIGLFLLAKFALKKFADDPESATFKQFQRLLYTCAGVAFIGGLLTGQYFGDIYTLFGIGNLALAPGVQEALQDPLDFIIIALLIGFVHINISHIIALVQAIKQKDKFTIIGKIGLFMLELGIPGILHSILKADIPGFTPQIYSIFSWVMMAGIVLIFVSSILINKGLGAILWIFDITNLLGDVMSYARLAGVGLATFYLAYTFNLMTTIFRDLLGGSPVGLILGIILSIIIIILGHTINLVLTAITGFMHSLRLCFVEFLFKFYEGGGTEYQPFKFKKRNKITLSIKS